MSFHKNRAYIARLPFGWLKPADDLGITLQSDDKDYAIPATVWNAHLMDVE